MRLTAFLLALAFSTAMHADVDLDKVKKGDAVGAFKVNAVYLNDADKPMGAQFVHSRSGFTLDVLRIESVPQAYTWVNSFPVSDQGEPHTQEHLLLGKGTVGRAYSAALTMSLGEMNAFTQQWRTSYHFGTPAGADVFFDLYRSQLNALLHPNYSDEEIRREVRNFGVTENADKTLRLEEKGTVYNEMMSSMPTPFFTLFYRAFQTLYGSAHPLSYEAGGLPSGIRTMKPEDIRRFHRENYYLANMGSIVSFPADVPIEEILKRTDAILRAVEPEASTRKAKSFATLPKPEPAPAGKIDIVDYPQKNEQQPSPIALVFPANRDLAPRDVMLLQLFLDNIASDSTSNLYKMFIDSKTRVMDVGARSVFNDYEEQPGEPVAIVLTDVAVSNFTPEKLGEIRKKVTGEIDRIANLPDNSADLKEFNERLANRLVERQRDLAKFVNTPPRFGARNTFSSWMDQLFQLGRTDAFRKSVTMKPETAYVRKQLAPEKNVWRDLLQRAHIASTTPYVLAVKPSPALVAREETERIARANAEAERLAKQYGVTDAQEAMHRYNTEYDAASAKIDGEAKNVARTPFVKSPPMTMDDQLIAEVTAIGGIPMVASKFENMTSAQVGLALRADTIPQDHLRFVSLLPLLLTRVGVIENGKAVSYDEMSERLRNEILSLDANYSLNPRTNRVELAVRGAGIGEAEVSRAIDWMSLTLNHPDWRPENLARIRDVLDQELSRLRNVPLGSEESWVQNPFNAYRMQANPLYLAADSVFTREHNALRLKWMLKDVSAADREAVSKFLSSFIASIGSGEVVAERGLRAGPPPRATIEEMLTGKYVRPFMAEVPEHARPLTNELMKDLDLALVGIPDSTLYADLSYLCDAIRSEIATGPTEALERLDETRRALLHQANARMWEVGSSAMQTSIKPKIAALAATLDKNAAPRATYATTRAIDARLRARDATAIEPVYVGLFAPNMKGGVVITSVPSAHYSDFADKDKQLDYLASRLYGGGGPHAVFIKTIGAGLAYSNGIRGGLSGARIGYYAERTPEIPQTLKFVTNIIKTSPRDPSLADYTIAQAFGEFRASQTYETRAEAMAADLADQQPPAQVRSFRESILELRKDPTLGDQLFDRKDKVYARAIPGYGGVRGRDVKDAVYFAIGPDKQLDAFDAYIKAAEGDEKLFRLYARDYWMP
jgi:Zn-dependent M16 (insulinase) family peptidase